MGGTTFGTSYPGYTIFICLVSGCLLLWFDAKTYKSSGMKKEKKAAQALGWFNLATGGAALLAKVIFM